MYKNKGYKKIFGVMLPEWVDEKTVKTIVGFFLSIIVFLLIMVLFVWPAQTKMKQLSVSVTTAKSKLDSLKKSKQNLDDLERLLPTENRNILFRAMPIEYSPDMTIFLIRGMGRETGIQLMNYTLPGGALSGREDKGEKFSFLEHKIQITVSGSIENILKFIERVEQSLPFGSVSDLNVQELSRLSKFSQANNIQTALEIVYFQPLLGAVNLSDAKQFSEGDMKVVNDILKHKQAVAEQIGLQSETGQSAGGINNNIFGL